MVKQICVAKGGGNVLHRKTEFDNVKAKLMKKHSEATQTLRAGCSKAD